MLAVLGRDPFRADMLASGGMDDWRSGGRYLAQAEELMADAVGASSAFFSTCGSSLSVRAAMMALPEVRTAVCSSPGQPQVHRWWADFRRHPPALDHPTLGCRASLVPPAVT
ncbi:putative orn/Lys/Arg decarboxylase [Mycobacterium xenopi 3993]|nr:putative orn/Lys/Arg decarboxylase [Mycobacterium xenopi 3993]